MKSFSARVKEHLCEKCLEELGIGEKAKEKWNECCGNSFLRAILLFLSKPCPDGDEIFSTFPLLLEIVAFVLIRSFDLEAKVDQAPGGRRGYSLHLPQGERERILRESAHLPEKGCERCRVLFVRGAFLSCGTVLDPAKGYHAAFSPCGEEGIGELCRTLSLFDISLRRSKNKNGVLLYLKESAAVEDLLSLMGSQRYSLEMMNQKIDKSIRAGINRRQNFEDANLKKTVNGAQSVIRAIRFLEAEGVLETLPEPLQKVAKLRTSYPEVSLTELVERYEEEITKSGLNHRLQKLCAIAEKWKKKDFE